MLINISAETFNNFGVVEKTISFQQYESLMILINILNMIWNIDGYVVEHHNRFQIVLN